MKKLETRLFLIIFFFSQIIAIQVFALSDEGIVLIDARGSDRFPDMDNEILVYLNDDLSSEDIWIFNFTSNTSEYITRDSIEQGIPRISENIIVWTQEESAVQSAFGKNHNIFMYDLDTQEKTQLTSEVQTYNPDVFEGRIVWCEPNHENTTNIRMYDVETGEFSWITNAKAGHTEKINYWNPRIFDDKIVCSRTYSYIKNNDGFWECDIILFDLESGQSFVISPEEEKEHLKETPVIYDNLVAWFDLRNERRSGGHNAKDVYLYDLSTSRETRITSDASALPFRLSIYGDVIVWEDSREDTYDIYMYDVSKGEVINLTSDEILQGCALAYEDYVFWSDNREGHFNIHVLDLTGEYSFIDSGEPVEDNQLESKGVDEGFIPISNRSIVIGFLVSIYALLYYENTNHKSTLRAQYISEKCPIL